MAVQENAQNFFVDYLFLLQDKSVEHAEVYQFITNTSAFQCIVISNRDQRFGGNSIESFYENQPGLFVCSIEFAICYKKPGSPEVHRLWRTEKAQCWKKDVAKKAAWNKVIKATYETLSTMQPTPVLTI